MKQETQNTLYGSIQPILLDLMSMKGKISRFDRNNLFPRLVEAVNGFPAAIPALLLGFGDAFFASPFNTVRGNQYVMRKVQNEELAITLMDCIYIKFFECERLAYLRGVMPELSNNLKLEPWLSRRIKMSYFNADVSVVVTLMDDLEMLEEAVNEEGARLYRPKLPMYGHVPRPIPSTC